jgi:hypothetical protein
MGGCDKGRNFFTREACTGTGSTGGGGGSGVGVEAGTKFSAGAGLCTGMESGAGVGIGACAKTETGKSNKQRAIFATIFIREGSGQAATRRPVSGDAMVHSQQCCYTYSNV